MIVLNVEQGSEEWLAARLGVPTASQFSRIISNKTAKLSTQADGYAHQLIAEQLLGIPMDNASSGFMQRGSEMEKTAISFYEMQRECDTEKVGFILRDDRRVGCSPDRLVGTDGLLEIKCPSAPVHIGYLLDETGIGYRAQVQGQLWLTGREWVDTLSYHPDMPSALVRQVRDAEYIAALAKAVDQFISFIDESKEKLRRLGLFAEGASPAAEPMRPRLVRQDSAFPFAATDQTEIDNRIKAGRAENEERAARAGL